MSAVEEYQKARIGGPDNGLWFTMPRNLADTAIAEMEAENERAWGERDHYLRRLQERNTQLQQAEAVASSSDDLLGEATRWAKDARERADKAEAALAERAEEVGRLKIQLDTVARFPETNHARAIIADLRAHAKGGSETP